MTSLVKAIQERLAKKLDDAAKTYRSIPSELNVFAVIRAEECEQWAEIFRNADLSDLEPKVIGAREFELETQVASQAVEIKRLKWILHKIVSLDNDAHPGLFTWHDMRVQAHKEAEAVLATKEANNG